jgi:hypothetical protein
MRMLKDLNSKKWYAWRNDDAELYTRHRTPLPGP